MKVTEADLKSNSYISKKDFLRLFYKKALEAGGKQLEAPISIEIPVQEPFGGNLTKSILEGKYKPSKEFIYLKDLAQQYIQAEVLSSLLLKVEGNINFLIISFIPKNVIEYFEEEYVTNNMKRLNKKSKPSIYNKNISSIIFIRKGNQVSDHVEFLVVNEDFDNRIRIKSLSNNLRKLAELSNSKTKETVFNKQLFDYINLNSKCVIYCKGKYDLTDIFVRTGINMMKINSAISVKIVLNKYLKSFINA